MIKNIKTKTSEKEMVKVMNDPQYRGKHVIAVAGKVFTAKTGDGASQILAQVRKKYPDKTPAVTYIPDADTLIV